ncbi:MAG: hypothetical protein UR28_C0036G0008 [Candidatus Peregrinibacteria bacterium GW2011_GWF2_33_10]|nr:MAG: hypothetical protein UR28_C0036G0008 [Candidatus Peregrinibacteria bacterium GW2011_GWF2_33_10]
MQTISFKGNQMVAKWRAKGSWLEMSSDNINALLNEEMYLKIKTQEEGDIDVQIVKQQ